MTWQLLRRQFNTDECRYNTVQYNTAYIAAVTEQNKNQSLNAQNTRNIFLYYSYMVSFVRNLEKIDRVIPASHCTKHYIIYMTYVHTILHNFIKRLRAIFTQ